jgi:hypothetical protein
MRASFTRTAVCLLLMTAGAVADTLPLPNAVVDFRSADGQRYLEESRFWSSGYGRISAVFETQKTQSYCGVASMAMALNALGAPAPVAEPYSPYAVFTQDNILNEKTDAIRPREAILMRGMTLDQLGRIASLYPVEVQVHHAGAEALETFRSTAVKMLESGDAVVIVNFLRSALGEQRGGHFSPLGAYDEKEDRFLVLDVARYKYPPAWVKAADLFAAMNTPDSDNDDNTRGYVVLSRRAAAPSPAAR